MLHHIETLEPTAAKKVELIMSPTSSYMLNLVVVVQDARPHRMGEVISYHHFPSYFFLSLHAANSRRSTPSTNCTYIKRCGFIQGSAFWRFVVMSPRIGELSSKNHRFRADCSRFSEKCKKNIQSIRLTEWSKLQNLTPKGEIMPNLQEQ
jgi:hypothetical protein